MTGISSHGYTSAEYYYAWGAKEVATQRQIAMLANLAIMTAAAIEAYTKQKAAADRTMNITQKQLNRLKEIYWPRELQHLEEFAGNPEPIEPIEVMGSRYGGRLNAAVAGAYAKAILEVECKASRYCTSANEQAMESIFIGRAIDEANARVKGRQIAFAEYRAKEDVNFDRRIKAIGIGAGAIGDAASLAGKAAATFAGQFAQYFGGMSDALKGFAYAARTPYTSSQQFHTDLQRQMEQQFGIADFNATYSGTDNSIGSGVRMNPLGTSLLNDPLMKGNTEARDAFGPGIDINMTAGMERDWFYEQTNNASTPMWMNIDRSGMQTFPVSMAVAYVTIDQFDFVYVDDVEVTRHIYGKPL